MSESGIPPVTVDGPLPAPGRAVGLYAAASLVDEPRPVVGGVELPGDSNGGHGLWLSPCGPSDEVKSGDDGAEVIRFPGTAVWAAEDCHLLGVSEEESRDRARLRLARFEPVDVERHLAPLLEERSVAGSSLADAQARMMVAGLAPVVHIAPESLEGMLREKQVLLSGQRLVTPLGASVAVGAGYTEALGASVIVTGPVTVWRSPVEVHTGLRLSGNRRLTVAERAVAVSWQGQAIKIGGTP